MKWIEGSLRLQLLCYWIAVSSTSLNPIAYACLNRDFMKYLRARFRWPCCVRSSRPSTIDATSINNGPISATNEFGNAEDDDMLDDDDYDGNDGAEYEHDGKIDIDKGEHDGKERRKNVRGWIHSMEKLQLSSACSNGKSRPTNGAVIQMRRVQLHVQPCIVDSASVAPATDDGSSTSCRAVAMASSDCHSDVRSPPDGSSSAKEKQRCDNVANSPALIIDPKQSRGAKQKGRKSKRLSGSSWPAKAKHDKDERHSPRDTRKGCGCWSSSVHSVPSSPRHRAHSCTMESNLYSDTSDQSANEPDVNGLPEQQSANRQPKHNNDNDDDELDVFVDDENETMNIRRIDCVNLSCPNKDRTTKSKEMQMRGSFDQIRSMGDGQAKLSSANAIFVIKRTKEAKQSAV